MRRNVCALRMMHTRYRWMRPHGATQAGTQAPPLPTSIKSLFRQSFLVFVHRQSLPAITEIGFYVSHAWVACCPIRYQSLQSPRCP